MGGAHQVERTRASLQSYRRADHSGVALSAGRVRVARCNGLCRYRLGHLSHHAATVQQGEDLAYQVIDTRNAEK